MTWARVRTKMSTVNMDGGALARPFCLQAETLVWVVCDCQLPRRVKPFPQDGTSGWLRRERPESYRLLGDDLGACPVCQGRRGQLPAGKRSLALPDNVGYNYPEWLLRPGTSTVEVSLERHG